MDSDAHDHTPRAHRCQRTHSDEMHARVVKMHTEQYSVSQIVAQTGVPRSTVRMIVAQWRDNGQVMKRRRGGNRKPVISDAVNYCIERIQHDDPAARLCDIQRDIDDAFIQRAPSLSSIHRRLRVWIHDEADGHARATAQHIHDESAT